MTQNVVSPDLVTRSAPLGLRFFDPVLNAVVGDGLSVTATTRAAPPLRRDARASLSGVYVFHDLPGLSRYARADASSLGSVSALALPVRVSVEDPLGRFQPFRFDAVAPERGLFEPTCGGLGSFSRPWPLTPGPAITLFSTPSREVPLVFARVRAELWDPVRELPAAWALVEARVDGTLVARGLADADGKLALFFAYPEPTDLPPGSLSTPIALSPPLLEQRWQVELDAFYAPPPDGDVSPPDLCAVFAAAPAALWADDGRTTPLAPLELQFGRELVARTSSGTTALSGLWVTPA